MAGPFRSLLSLWAVPLAVPIALPFTGGADVPGRVPTPRIDNEPGPVHGRPVSGFVPVVLGSSPVGIVGETGFSLRGGKTVVFPLSTGLTVFPLSIGLLVFCANVAVAVRMRAPRPTSPMRSATMVNLPIRAPRTLIKMKSRASRRH